MPQRLKPETLASEKRSLGEDTIEIGKFIFGD
jgi:hypothetical protein